MAVMTMLTAASAAADEFDYQTTYSMCMNETDFQSTRIEKIIYYLSYVSVRKLGPDFTIEEVAHIHNVDTFWRNFKATALNLDVTRDQELKRLFESADFYRALQDCLPDAKYPNAAHLRTAFILELASQAAVGKMLGLSALLASGKGIGLAFGALRQLSSRAFYWTMAGLVGTAVTVPVLSNILEEKSVEEVFPRWNLARSQNLSPEAQSRAAREDFLVLAEASDQNLSKETTRLNDQIDLALNDLAAKLNNETDESKRKSLNEKIALLRAAREQN